MEKINFNFSTKNIPLSKPDPFFRRLIESTEKFIRSMRWRAFFFLHPDAQKEDKETYGFNSRRPAPYISELQPFEDSMRQLIQSVKFRDTRAVNNQLQQVLKNDLNKIKADKKIFVKADKTSNFYRTSTDQYKELLKKKTLKKITQRQMKTSEMPSPMRKLISSIL